MLIRGSELQFTLSIEGLRHQIAGPSLGSVDRGSVDPGLCRPGLQPRARSALRVSNRPATRGAEVRARMGKRAALAAEVSAWRHRDQPHRTIRLRGDGPDQSNHPADHRPSQKHVEQDDSRGVALIAPNYGRQEIQKNQEKQGQHSAPLSLQPRRGRHPCAPLSNDTLPPLKMFPQPSCWVPHPCGFGVCKGGSWVAFACVAAAF